MFNNALKNIDIFGAKFGFKIKKQESYKTAFGGSLTIFTLTIIIIFSVFMGQDFYYRINPSIYMNTIVPEKYDPAMTLMPDNFTLAWRIEGDDKFALNFSKVLYPVMKRFNFKRNAKDEMELMEDVPMELTKCTPENAKVEEFSKFNKLDDWYCFDWTKEKSTFGGFWDGDYVNAFQTLLFLCENGVEYNSQNPNCTRLEDYREFSNKYRGLQMSVMYPQYYFAADDLKNPLRITYKNYYYYFNLKTFKIDRFFFNKIGLSDDQGWIFEDIMSSSILSYNRMTFDSNLNEIFDGASSQLYEFNLYMEKSSQVIRRSFMKIQDVSAKVGGLIKLIMTMFSLINVFFSNFLFQVSVFNEIFDFPESGLHSNSKAGKFMFNSISKARKNSEDENKVKSLERNTFAENTNKKSQIEKDDNNEMLESLGILRSENHLRYAKNNNNNIAKLNNYLPNRKISEDDLNATKIKGVPNSEINMNDKKPNQNIDFSTLLVLKSYVCNPKNDSDTKKLQVFSNLTDYLNQRLDLIYYLRTLYSFDVTNSLLFNSFQKKMLDYPFKPNIFSKEDLHAFGLDKQKEGIYNKGEINDYFVKRSKEKKLDKYDSKIIKILPEALTKNIDIKIKSFEKDY